jgi:hypothetical protein
MKVENRYRVRQKITTFFKKKFLVRVILYSTG